jgi:hypothetical protein
VVLPRSLSSGGASVGVPQGESNAMVGQLVVANVTAIIKDKAIFIALFDNRD